VGASSGSAGQQQQQQPTTACSIRYWRPLHDAHVLLQCQLGARQLLILLGLMLDCSVLPVVMLTSSHMMCTSHTVCCCAAAMLLRYYSLAERRRSQSLPDWVTVKGNDIHREQQVNWGPCSSSLPQLPSLAWPIALVHVLTVNCEMRAWCALLMSAAWCV
jgi:hypothetical protein